MTEVAQVDSDGGSVPGSELSASFVWTGSRSLAVATADGLGATLSYGPASGRLETMEIGSLGGFSFTWDDARNLKVGRSASRGTQDIAGGLGWSAEYDQEGRQVAASLGPDGNLGRWTFGYGKADELLFRVEQSGGMESFASGVDGRIESSTSFQGSTALRYDDEGRRIEDDGCLYTWDWRGRLVQVDFKPTASLNASERLAFTYDASGRLVGRTTLGLPDMEGERPFIAAEAFSWDGQRLAAEAGLNFEGEVLWRRQYLPGPRWLDDAPLVRVEAGLHGGTPSTGTYNLVRDEMGTALAVVEHSTGQSPVLLARYLGSAFGRTRVELGPELVSIAFDPTVSELGDDAQEPIEEESVAGALVINTTLTVASSSLEEGLAIDRWSGTEWETAPRSEFAIGEDPSEATALLVMRLPAWPKGERYRITLTSALTDEFGRSLQLENDNQVTLAIPDDGITPPRYVRVFEIDRDTALAAANTLNGAFPGGQPIGFQGAWTDPATGLTYHRNRWYDPETASWLSRDPAGDVDSPNLYAFVGWAPFQAIDPLGESVRIHLYTKHSGLTSAQLVKLASLVEEYFLRLPWHGSPDASSAVFPFSFEDYESTGTVLPPRKTVSYAPRSMEITRPSGLIHASEYYLKYTEYIEENRAQAEKLEFDFHVFAELFGTTSAFFKRETAEDPEQGGYNVEGRAYVLEHSFSGIASLDPGLSAAHGEYLELLFISLLTAHEVGHSFGLSPRDKDALISGSGVMATRETLEFHLVGFLKKLSELAGKRGGYEMLSEREIADAWYSIFRYSDYDAIWILNLADPR